MIVPDVNVLVYAYDDTSPQHRAARRWWEEALSGSEPIGVPWIVVLAFVRLMTHPTLAENPMTVEEVRAAVASWLELDHVRLLSPSAVNRDDHVPDGTGGVTTRCTFHWPFSKLNRCLYSTSWYSGRSAE